MGITNYYDENSYVKCGLAVRDGKQGLLLEEYVGDGIRSSRFTGLSLPAGSELSIRMEGYDEGRRFSYLPGGSPQSSGSSDGWIELGEITDVLYLSSGGLQKGKRFTGATVGIYVHGDITGTFTDWDTVWDAEDWQQRQGDK